MLKSNLRNANRHFFISLSGMMFTIVALNQDFAERAGARTSSFDLSVLKMYLIEQRFK